VKFSIVCIRSISEVKHNPHELLADHRTVGPRPRRRFRGLGSGCAVGTIVRTNSALQSKPENHGALTFDDRPNPAVTLRLLDLFDRYSVRAIFFLMGRFARVPAAPHMETLFCFTMATIGRWMETVIECA
jgi:Polysaccharide deacetylase